MGMHHFYATVDSDRRQQPTGTGGNTILRVSVKALHNSEPEEVVSVECYESEDGKLHVSVFPKDAAPVIKWEGWPTTKLAALHQNDVR